MTSKETDQSRQRNLLLIVSGLLVLAVGLIVGLLVGGGSDDPEAEATTTLPPPTAPPSTVPSASTIVETSTTSTVPPTTTTTTLPADIGADINVRAIADATIESDSPEERLGGDDNLTAKMVGTDFEMALMRFEVDGIPDDAIVSQATLRLFVLNDGGSPTVNSSEGAWEESTVSWSNAPTVGDVIAPIPDVPEESFVRINVTSYVKGNGVIDLVIVNENDNEYEVVSREDGEGPLLEIVLGDGEAVLTGAGDIAGCDSDGDEATAALIDEVIAEEEDSLVFTLGDNAYEDGSPDNFAECYHTSWGRHKGITYPSTGAREYRTSGASGYFAYFGSVAGDPEEGFYSYDYGGWHMIVLNSNCGEVGGCGEDSVQANWLEQDLLANDAQCTLAYWHHPAFGSTSDGVNSEVIPLWEILYGNGAELVLNGDHHFYERFAAQDPMGVPDDNGLIQFTVGTGGHSLAEVGSPAANSEVAYDEAFGILVLTLTPDAFSWEFRTAPDSTVVDSGQGTCH